MISVVLIGREGRPQEPLPETNRHITEACANVAEHYARYGYTPPWCAYLAVRDDFVVGTCGFRGPPDDQDQVEIAYRTFPGWQGEGLASAMARAMVGIARDHNPVMSVAAFTWREEGPATRILEGLGFEKQGDEQDHYYGDCWRWRLSPTISV